MFNHSIKVPRLYKLAAKYAKEASDNHASVKQLVYQKKHPNVKGLYALIAETLKRYDEIENLFKRSQILTKEQRLDHWLARILVTELLWGKKKLTGESKPVKTVVAYRQIFQAHLSGVVYPQKEAATEKKIKPRYVRVNTLKISVDDAINSFRDEGWVLVRYMDNNYNEFLQKVRNLGEEEFMVDMHVKELLIFSPKAQFYNHNAYVDGLIVLQDKASCLPVQILNPTPGSTVLDMCAAPGMKTTQLAAMINNEGTVYAVEFDQKRYETMNKMIELTGASCVKTLNKDVITVTSKECPDVEYVLVDPSCSGSGIVDRLGANNTFEKRNLSRLEKLAGFQIKILKHALNHFPTAKRIVYSTCSIYTEENEEIVKEVLAWSTKFKLVPAKNHLPGPWVNFGSNKYGNIGKYCLYAKPDKDLTNGFFIAVFERLEEGEINEFNETMKKNRKLSDNEDLMEFVDLDESADGGKQEKSAKKNKRKHRREVEESDSMEVVNLDVTENGIDELENDNLQSKKGSKKKRKDMEDELENYFNSNEKTLSKRKKHKKKSKDLVNLENMEDSLNQDGNSVVFESTITEEIHSKKHKKKRRSSEEITENVISNEETSHKKEKHKKSKDVVNIEDSLIEEVDYVSEEISSKKHKKKRKHMEEIEKLNEDRNDFSNSEEVLYKTKKHKKSKETIDLEIINNRSEGKLSKKHKKKTKKHEVTDFQNSNNINGIELNEEVNGAGSTEEVLRKHKKHKKRSKEISENLKGSLNELQNFENNAEENIPKKHKKKRKSSVNLG